MVAVKNNKNNPGVRLPLGYSVSLSLSIMLCFPITLYANIGTDTANKQRSGIHSITGITVNLYVKNQRLDTKEYTIHLKAYKFLSSNIV